MARGGFPGGMGNMQNLMKQAQQMQRQMQQAQEELESKEFEGSAGGVVTAKVNGKKELLSLNIKPEAVDPDDVEGMKNAILYCIEHREALNRASREYVRRFENSDVATQISNVYISL